jgi:predicted esterase
MDDSPATTLSNEQVQLQQWQTARISKYAFNVHLFGSPVERAERAIIALPNRWSDPARFLRLAAVVPQPTDLPITALIGLEPPDWQYFWYPHSEFDAALDRQRPYLDISLAAIEQVLQRLVEHVSIEHITLLGFAEGACLALEYAARNAYPFNAIIALSGLLLGSSLDTSDRFNLASSKTKVFISASNAQSAGMRVRYTQTAHLLKQYGYKVIALTYERRPTTLSPEELEMSRSIMCGTVNDA